MIKTVNPVDQQTVKVTWTHDGNVDNFTVKCADESVSYTGSKEVDVTGLTPGTEFSCTVTVHANSLTTVSDPKPGKTSKLHKEKRLYTHLNMLCLPHKC